jgi:protein phosphatase
MTKTQAPAAPVVAPGPRSGNTPSGGAPQAPSPRPGNAQWIGTRQEQQDAFGFAGFDERGQARDQAVLAVVADGMGGLSGGRAASQGAVSAFLAAWNVRPAQQSVPETLLVAIEAANRAVHQLACTTAGEGEVGTTLVAVVITGNQLYWIAAGDSRIYWYRAADGSLTPCNEEHKLALQLWRQAPDSGMSADEIDHYPGHDHLISFLGLAAIPEIDRNLRPLSLQPGDWLLLCSDGVDGTLTLEDLSANLAGDPQRAAEGIIALVQAQNRPHQDNATVAILAFAEPTAGVGAPASEPPTRRRSVEPPSRPAKKMAKTAILLSGGLILAGLLGIGGWYFLQDPSQHGPAEKSSAPVAARISQPLEIPPRAEPEGLPVQQAADGQVPEPIATAPASAHVPANGDGEVAKTALPAEPPAPPEHVIDSPEAQTPAPSPPAERKVDGGQAHPDDQNRQPPSPRPPNHPGAQFPLDGANQHRTAEDKPAATPVHPVQQPPGPGRSPSYPYPPYPLPPRTP